MSTRAHSSKVISFYNNKGGVSKTTTLFNTAALLASSGSKVLIVDCDPQCNATELFFASQPTLDDPTKDLPGTSIYQAFQPRFSGDSPVIDIDAIKLVRNSEYHNLSILRGDFDFALAESYFATAINQAITEDVHQKKTYVSMHHMLRTLASHHKFDYIFCDVGPSTGAIPRMVLLSCDGFFIPVTPDRFSNQAIRSLGRVLSMWTRKHDETRESLRPFGVEPFPGKPTLLGAINQNFKIHRTTKTKASYEKWQERIGKSITEVFFDERTLPVSSKLTKKNPYVANIRDVGPTAPIAQMFGVAIFDVRQEHTKQASTTGSAYYGAVWDSWGGRQTEYKHEIENIVKALK
jgi:cellulose biosynthesis protein BcsQ